MVGGCSRRMGSTDRGALQDNLGAQCHCIIPLAPIPLAGGCWEALCWQVQHLCFVPLCQ